MLTLKYYLSMLWSCCFLLLLFIGVVSLGLNQVPWLKAKVNDRKKWPDGSLPDLVASDANSCLLAEELQAFCCRRGSGNTRNNLASYLLRCVGVRHSEIEKWSVQCMCEITFAGVNLVSVFIWRFYMWCYFRSLRIVIIIIHSSLLKVLPMLWIWVFGFLITWLGVELSPLSAPNAVVSEAVKVNSLPSSCGGLGTLVWLPWFGAVIFTVLSVELLCRGISED